ncbi:MAG TPA: hypothetical protein VFZ00_14060 [Solirubrobacter sp.]|nr:hypothetical protein [Solirubrobacter sp.]
MVAPRPAVTPVPTAVRRGPSRQDLRERRQVAAYVRMLLRTNPTEAQRRFIRAMFRDVNRQPKGSTRRTRALGTLRVIAITARKPPKPISSPTPVPTPEPTPAATVEPTPAPTVEPTPTP